MAKNLYDFAEENGKCEQKSCLKSEKPSMNEEFVKSKVQEYSSMSQGEMMQKLFSEVQASKANGTFDFNKISSSVEMVKDYLTPDQQRTLQNLLNRIK